MGPKNEYCGRNCRRLLSKVLAIAVFTLPISANACLAVEDWQQFPSVDTVKESSGIYLARFSRLEPESDFRVSVVLDTKETLIGKNRDRLSIIVDQISAVHGSQKLSISDHSGKQFWEGSQSNTRLMPDCSYAPVEYYVGDLYLVMLHGDRLSSSVSFERIEDPIRDRWYQFVRCNSKKLVAGQLSDSVNCDSPLDDHIQNESINE